MLKNLVFIRIKSMFAGMFARSKKKISGGKNLFVCPFGYLYHRLLRRSIWRLDLPVSQTSLRRWACLGCILV